MLKPRLLAPQAFQKCRLLSRAQLNKILCFLIIGTGLLNPVLSTLNLGADWIGHPIHWQAIQYCWSNLAGETTVTDLQQHFRLLMLSRCHNQLQSLPITFSCCEQGKKLKAEEWQIHLPGYTISSINVTLHKNYNNTVYLKCFCYKYYYNKTIACLGKKINLINFFMLVAERVQIGLQRSCAIS